MQISRRTMLSSMAAAGAVLGLGGCSQNLATGRNQLSFYSEDDERAMAAKDHPKLVQEFGGVVDDPQLGAYVAQIGGRLVKASEKPAMSFTFTLLDSPIVNAFAMPGGYVYVTRGLMALAADEAQFAGVVGHEIGHVMARHSVERISQAQVAQIGLGILGAALGNQAVSDLASYGAMAYLQSYSRDQEFEADMLGVRYLAGAGWEPKAMAGFLANLREHSRLEAMLAGRDPDTLDQFDMMSTHPRTVDRVEAATAQALSRPPVNPQTGRDAYLELIDGMIYGDSPEQGVSRDRVFAHPVLGFQFAVPQGFRIVNTPDSVKAYHPDGGLILFDGKPVRRAGAMTDYIRQEWAPKARLENLQAIEVNGMPGAAAFTQGRTKSGVVDLTLVAVQFSPQRIYRFQFMTPTRLTASLNEELRRTTYSFRALNDAEKAAIKPHRVRMATVKPGDSVDSLAATLPFQEYRLERFRALNSLVPGQPLPPVGSRVKVIA